MRMTKHRGLSEARKVEYLPMTKELPIGTLRSHDEDYDGNDNVKKAIVLHFFAVFARLRRENAYIVSCFLEDVNKQRLNFPSLSERG